MKIVLLALCNSAPLGLDFLIELNMVGAYKDPSFIKSASVNPRMNFLGSNDNKITTPECSFDKRSIVIINSDRCNLFKMHL